MGGSFALLWFLYGWKFRTQPNSNSVIGIKIDPFTTRLDGIVNYNYPKLITQRTSLSWVCTCNPSHQPGPSNPPTKHSPNLQGYTLAWPAVPGLIGMDLGSILGPCLYHDLNFWSYYWMGRPWVTVFFLFPSSSFFLVFGCKLCGSDRVYLQGLVPFENKLDFKF